MMTEPRKTPFYDVGLQHGAKMIEMFGYFLPWEYSTGQQAEHLGTRQAASLCDLDYMGEFLIEGPGALALVQRLATNDFRSKSVGSIGYTAMCDESGLMVDDGTVWRLGDREFMFVTGDEQDFLWLEENAKDLDVTAKNITAEHTTLALQGPQSAQVLRRLTSFELGTLPYYHFGKTSVAGVDCLIARMGYTGRALVERDHECGRRYRDRSPGASSP
jgi:aminomethyltransferase